MNEIEDTTVLGQENQRPTLARSAYNSAVLAAAAVSYGFELSPANEALRVKIGLDVLESTQSSLAVGAVTAALTFGIEIVPSSLISVGLNGDSKPAEYLTNKFSKREGVTETEVEVTEKEVSHSNVAIRGLKKVKTKLVDPVIEPFKDIGISLGIGAGALVIKRHLADSEPNLKEDMRNSVKASSFIAAVSGVTGYLVAGGIEHAEDTPFEVPAEYFVDYATDTRFWLSLFGAVYGIKGANALLKKIRNKDKEDKDDQSNSYRQSSHQPIDPTTLKLC